MFGRKKKGEDPLDWRVPVRSVAQPAPEESAPVVKAIERWWLTEGRQALRR